MFTGVNLIFRLFPPPTYLAPPAAGVDISDHSIKFAVVASRRGRIHLSCFGEKPIPPGIIDAGQINDKKELAERLRQLAIELPTKYVAVSLPEERSFLVKLQLPRVDPTELRESILLQLEEHIPLPPAEVIFDYEILDRNEGDKLNLAVTVLPQKIVKDHLEVLADAGLTPLSFEVESQAVVRAVTPRGNREAWLVVDFGKTRTGFIIAGGAVALFTSTIPNIGGENATAAIRKKLNLDWPEAEKLKSEHGLLYSSKNQFVALLPLIAAFRDEIHRLIRYWNRGPDRDSVGEIKKVVLCGGQAIMPGLVEFLGATLEIPVILANVWTNIADPEEVPPIHAKEATRYAIAIGLTLKSLLENNG